MQLQPFKRNYTQHALAVADWMVRHGARGHIDAITYQLTLHLGEREATLYPMFVREHAQAGIAYVPGLCGDVSGFAGWLPYRRRVWPAAADKLDFKAFAQRHQLPVPAWTQDAAAPRGTVLVKRRRSSFGSGQRGPFNVPPTALTLAPGEYAEQFIPGQLIKAWFCGDRLAAAEVVPMPAVVGDGRQTLADLVQQLPGAAPAREGWDSAMQHLAALQGLPVHSVPAAGRQVLVDYRYMSPLNRALQQDENRRDALLGTPLDDALLAMARATVAELPPDQRHDTVYSVDGVLDSHHQPWWLEVNCCPLLHPACYDALRCALLGPEELPA